MRVVGFYVSCLLRPACVLRPAFFRLPPASCLLLLLVLSSSSSLSSRRPRSTTTIPVFPAGHQPRPSTPTVPCRTSTTTIHAQCSLPDLNHDHPRPVFPAGPHHDHPRPVFPAGPQPRLPDRSGHCRPLTGRM